MSRLLVGRDLRPLVVTVRLLSTATWPAAFAPLLDCILWLDAGYIYWQDLRKRAAANCSCPAPGRADLAGVRTNSFMSVKHLGLLPDQGIAKTTIAKLDAKKREYLSVVRRSLVNVLLAAVNAVSGSLEVFSGLVVEIASSLLYLENLNSSEVFLASNFSQTSYISHLLLPLLSFIFLALRPPPSP